MIILKLTVLNNKGNTIITIDIMNLNQLLKNNALGN